jgi:hypothetical protein
MYRKFFKKDFVLGKDFLLRLNSPTYDDDDDDERFWSWGNIS